MLRDDRVVFNTAATRPTVVMPIQLEGGGAAALIGTDPAPTNLAGFDRLRVPAREYLPVARDAEAPAPGFSSFVLAENPVTPPEWRLSWHRPAMRDNRYREVVRDGITNVGRKRRFRQGSPLDSFLTLRFDGRDETPVLGIRGAVSGAVWRKLN